MRRLLKYSLFTFLLTACASDESFDLKAPGSLSLSLDMSREPIKLGTLEFSNGYLRISGLQLDGDRVQAEDYFFQNGYQPPIQVPIDSTWIDGNLFFDLPQGIYNTIQLDFEIPSANIPTLYLEGRFRDSTNLWVNLKLEIDSFERFSLLAQNPQGETEIVLQEGIESRGLIRLNPEHWFSGISIEQLRQAERTLIGGEEILLISRNVNSNMYSEIDNRLDELNQFIIR